VGLSGDGRAILSPRAGVAQLVERQLPKLNVAGSSPVSRCSDRKCERPDARCASGLSHFLTSAAGDASAALRPASAGPLAALACPGLRTSPAAKFESLQTRLCTIEVPLFERSQLAAGHGFAVRPPPLLTLVLECVRETRLRRCAPHPGSAGSARVSGLRTSPTAKFESLQTRWLAVMTPLFERSQLAAGHGFAVRSPPLLTLVLECVRETRLRRCAPHPGSAGSARVSGLRTSPAAKFESLQTRWLAVMTPLFERSQLAAGHGFAVRPLPLLTLVLECVRETRKQRGGSQLCREPAACACFGA
jgi:hypothetical protein